MATANGDNVILNSMHLSGAVVPQQLSTRGTAEDTQVPLGFEDKLTSKNGVAGSQFPEGCAMLILNNKINNTKLTTRAFISEKINICPEKHQI